MKIVVLAGGLSPERNVSLSSGVMVSEALRSRGHRAALVDLYFGLENWEGTPEEVYDAPAPEKWRRVDHAAPDLAEVKAKRKWKSESQFGPGVLELCAGADAVFLALHGACGEDGRVQAALDLMGIPYTGSGHLGSAVAMDKDLTKRLCVQAGIATPQWRLLEYTEADIPALCESLTLPLVVKPMDSGSSIGVSIAHDRETLAAAMVTLSRYRGRDVFLDPFCGSGTLVIVEQYVSGREIQVGVLEEKALPSIEIIPKQGFYDYENKYQPGAAVEVCPAPVDAGLEALLEETAQKVHALVGLAVYSRSDFIVDAQGKPWFLEINTLPGMTPTSLVPQEAAAVGIGYGALCQTIVEASLKARKGGA